jgi:RES domain-containing protein
VKVYRARAWRGIGVVQFDPLDSTGSISGPKGWRFNDLETEILYAAEVEALATLEVSVRPGFETIQQVLIATIEVPDGVVTTLDALRIPLPRDWNARPASDASRRIARDLLAAIANLPADRHKPHGVRVPSVLSSTDFNVLLDPAHRNEYRASITNRIAFNTLRGTRS